MCNRYLAYIVFCKTEQCSNCKFIYADIFKDNFKILKDEVDIQR